MRAYRNSLSHYVKVYRRCLQTVLDEADIYGKYEMPRPDGIGAIRTYIRQQSGCNTLNLDDYTDSVIELRAMAATHKKLSVAKRHAHYIFIPVVLTDELRDYFEQNYPDELLWLPEEPTGGQEFTHTPKTDMNAITLGCVYQGRLKCYSFLGILTNSYQGRHMNDWLLVDIVEHSIRADPNGTTLTGGIARGLASAAQSYVTRRSAWETQHLKPEFHNRPGRSILIDFEAKKLMGTLEYRLAEPNLRESFRDVFDSLERTGRDKPRVITNHKPIDYGPLFEERQEAIKHQFALDIIHHRIESVDIFRNAKRLPQSYHSVSDIIPVAELLQSPEITLSAAERIYAVVFDGKSSQDVYIQQPLLSDDILHEFACKCTEDTIQYITGRGDYADQQAEDKARRIAYCKNVISTMRRWMCGEATDEELRTARAARPKVKYGFMEYHGYRATDPGGFYAAHDGYRDALALVPESQRDMWARKQLRYLLSLLPPDDQPTSTTAIAADTSA
jgi:hypothetical protein